ncbi:lipid A biosynthesis acyltransferase [Bathymodiolus japonicus methanotrophic gill symbiont]|uniref:LpxL/LpxP family acyltransferase n=1 Tax=Bathymodiolus japonicus methanotrophic gill symbiont TaxID=113269 RepID=UPI001E3017CE|nr:lipid A biosynthesis acyltransferase [Bathymodiolus japonicus methanotrophic gill symbiont]
MARSLLYPISLYFLLFAGPQRRASQQYLNRVLKHKVTWLDSAKHIHAFASTILDRVYLLTGQFAKLDITFPDENIPLSYSKDGVGCLLLGSHIGSFEVLRSYAVSNYPLPIKILMYEQQAPMMVKVLNALNADVADTLISLDGSPSGLLKVKEAIDCGTTVGLLGDRILGEGSEKTVICTLLGEPVKMSTAPILLAAALKVPLIVFFGVYLGGNRYKIHFELLAEEVILKRKTRQQDIQDYTQKYVDILEKQMLETPYNWFNFYDYWHNDKQ